MTVVTKRSQTVTNRHKFWHYYTAKTKPGGTGRGGARPKKAGGARRSQARKGTKTDQNRRAEIGLFECANPGGRNGRSGRVGSGRVGPGRAGTIRFFEHTLNNALALRAIQNKTTNNNKTNNTA